ncbi:MAG: hypothetical protein HWE16_01510 [Gammaproteobacteria bacterium]|nr:hypothetical protein [Gammaproteobacteria bacterium]
MKLIFNNSESLKIKLLSNNAENYIYDINLLVSLKTESVTINQNVWVDRYELEDFLSGLKKLQSNLKGQISFTSESPGELLLLIKSVDSSGHFALQIELGYQKYIGTETFWSKVLEVFPLETASLDNVCTKFLKYFSDFTNISHGNS